MKKLGKTCELVAKNVKMMREQRNLSQTEVAETSEVPQGQYSRIENCKVEPSISTLEKLAKVFGVSVETFFKEDELDKSLNSTNSVINLSGWDDSDKKHVTSAYEYALKYRKLKNEARKLSTED